MKRRRHTLQVSTFPFLAVLLCAMGSLILLLLVIDRRAKVVMRAKALEAVRQMEAEDAKQSAARAAEWDQRRRALHEQLQQQKGELEKQSASLKQQLAQAANELQAEQNQTPALAQRLQVEKDYLLHEEDVLAARVRETNQKNKQSEAASAELTRLGGELVKLEQTLDDLKTLRRRQQQTYSLVPYRGHHGDNRRPIYVECAAASIIFHPDRLTIPATDSGGSAIAQEVERRMKRQSLTGGVESKEFSPYLLLLVRPDGIMTYYRTLAALRDLKVDFGYEFVESGWILDFSQDQKATANWMVNETPPSQSGGRKPPESAQKVTQFPIPRSSLGAREPAGDNLPTSRGGSLTQPGNFNTGEPSHGTNAETVGEVEDMPPQLKGWRGFDSGEIRRLRRFASLPAGTQTDPPLTPGGAEGNAGIGPEPHSIGPLSGASPGFTQGTAGPRRVYLAGTSGSEGRTASDDLRKAGSLDSGSPSGRGESSSPLLSSQNPLTAALSRDPIRDGSASPAENRTATRKGDGPIAGDSSLLLGQSAPAKTGIPNGSSATNATAGQSAPSLIPTFAAPPSEGSGRSGNTTSAVKQAESPETEDHGPQLGNSSALSRLGAEGEKKPRPAPPVRRYVNREWNIFVECTADQVIIYPGGSRIAAAALGHPGTSQSQSLLQAIQQMIVHRQAMIASSKIANDSLASTPQIRFLVRPNGLRTYFLAYPELEPLRLPMTRENLEADEDVVRRVLGR